MAVQHTWSINEIVQLNNGTGTVSSVNLLLRSVDGDFNASISKRIDLETENIENFIEYKDLTEEIVLNWAKEILGQQMISRFESRNENFIEVQKNPPAPEFITVELPWT